MRRDGPLDSPNYRQPTITVKVTVMITAMAKLPLIRTLIARISTLMCDTRRAKLINDLPYELAHPKFKARTT